MEKDNKKKTLTISSDLKKKIDTSAISTDGKKSFSVNQFSFIDLSINRINEMGWNTTPKGFTILFNL